MVGDEKTEGREAGTPGAARLAGDLFWVEVAMRAIRLTREEDFLGEAEREALGVAERALNFVTENHTLRKTVARAKIAARIDALANSEDFI